MNEHVKSTPWPVNPAQYPLNGPTTGEVYVPDYEYEPVRRCGALCGILRAVLVIIGGLLLWDALR